MKNSLLYLTLIVCGLMYSCVPKEERLLPAQAVKQWYINSAAELDSAVTRLQRANFEHRSVAELHVLFDSARYAYKKIEYIVEYYNPATALSVNGPAIAKADEEDSQKIIVQEGFQVVEEMLFPVIDTNKQTELSRSIALLVSNTKRIRKVAATIELTDHHLFDAMRLQLFRMMTLGITGFDSPIAGHSLSEAVATLDGIMQTLDCYEGALNSAQIYDIKQRISTAQKFLRNAKNIEEFDHAEFIITHGTQLVASIQSFEKILSMDLQSDNLALSKKAVTLFALEAWNADYFAPAYARPLTRAKAALGKLLFYDPILSHNSDRACASCHQPERAYTDGLPSSRLRNGTNGKLRNAPTLIFAGMQNSLFYDMHVSYLEDQATGVITSPIEMHGSLDEVVKLLRQSPDYMQYFQQAFPESRDSVISERNIRSAIASFIRTLRPMNSPFDHFMRGNSQAISAEARRGFNLFSGKAKCATCHFMPLFNGTVPPNFTETEAEVLGVPSLPDTIHAEIDKDLGKYTISRAELDKHAFKTPTLRNIALTAPYMHNGVYTTLEEVIDFYNRGGGKGIGISLDNQTLPAERLQLRTEEKQALIAFLRSLTDTTGITSKPHQLPKIPGTMKNTRRVGGIY